MNLILKIALLTYGYGKEELGVGRYCYHLVEELRKMGLDVDVFTTKLRAKNLGEPIFFLRNAIKNLRHYDIVHSSQGSAIFVQHLNIVETYHHDLTAMNEPKYAFFSALENYHCRRARHIIVPSFNTKNVLVRFGHPAHKISVIYHGMDHEQFKHDERLRAIARKKYGIEKDFVVLSVGRLVRYKRQLDIVKALNNMTNCVFILIGKGEEKNNILKSASQTGVRLLHFEKVTDEQLTEIYNAADIYVHTAAVEGFGLSVVEAMACGLPVVVYKTADFDRIVGNAGFLMQVGDVEGITSAIKFLLEDDSKKAKMSENAVANSKKFTWSETAIQHLEVYRKVLNTN